MTYDILPFFESELSLLYQKKELESITYWCIESVLKLSRSQYIMSLNAELSQKDILKFYNIVNRLKTHEPLQYVLGECEFYSLSLKVNTSCLIPRPETEELVQWILEDNFKNALDIGTGSGCISIALAMYSEAKVTAFDISEDALLIANENARLNDVNVNFIKQDIFEDIKLENQFDLIVSNPPYVLTSEKQVMNENVLNFEPHLALFVDDNDALLYYQRIIEFSKVHLQINGSLFFEINEQKAKDITILLENNGFNQILIKNDMQGKNRMVKANRKL